jgi:hypothetical protein
LGAKFTLEQMEQVNDTNPDAGPTHIALTSMRTQARALISLGWVPSLDEPWRVYPLRGDTFSTLTTKKVWTAMHELLTEESRAPLVAGHRGIPLPVERR